MKNLNQNKWITLTSLGFICMVIPFIIYALWIRAFNLGSSQTERLLIFNEHLPDFLARGSNVTIISIAFSVLAIIFSSMSLMKLKGIWRLFNILTLVLSGVLLLLNIA